MGGHVGVYTSGIDKSRNNLLVTLWDRCSAFLFGLWFGYAMKKSVEK